MLRNVSPACINTFVSGRAFEIERTLKFIFMKPLGKKAYGSIPHLPGSRLGIGDYHISEGQAKIATEKKRDRHDLIIVQEKLDGSNVCVAKIKDEIIALTRAGYLATSSPFQQHQFFALWVTENESRFYHLLNEGERICGEWLALAHGTKYNLSHEPFVPFDIMQGVNSTNYETFINRIKEFDFVEPKLISIGEPFSVEEMLNEIKVSGHGAVDDVEGAVWRIERKGQVDFLTKFVRHEKQDGKYFNDLTRNGDVWNIDVSKWLDVKPPCR